MNIKRHIALILVTIFFLSSCSYHAEVARLPDAPLYNRTFVFNSVRYVPLIGFCNYYGLDWDWDFVSQKITVKKGKDALVLRPDSRLALINNKPVTLKYPIEYKDGAAYLSAKTALFISEDIFGIKERGVLPAPVHKINTVVIDPGHGGKDPGAVSRYGTREKDIVLDISKRLKKDLEKKGLKVYLTRDRDVFIPLQERPVYANKINADLFISVHANAAKRSRYVKGFEVYYLSEATDDNSRALAAAENASLKFEKSRKDQDKAESSKNPTLWDLKFTEQRRVSKELAHYICNITSDNLGMKKRGVKGARFVVLKGTTMPAVLVEVGFLTNAGEESKLKKSYFREKIATAITDSVLAYKREYEQTDGFSR